MIAHFRSVIEPAELVNSELVGIHIALMGALVLTTIVMMALGLLVLVLLAPLVQLILRKRQATRLQGVDAGVLNPAAEPAPAPEPYPTSGISPKHLTQRAPARHIQPLPANTSPGRSLPVAAMAAHSPGPGKRSPR